MNRYKSHGTGKFKRKDFAKIGKNVVLETGVLIFHPENVEIGSNVYIGYGTIIDGYHKNKLIIEDNVWIGHYCYLQAAGGLIIKHDNGIGPGVRIMSSVHDLYQDDLGPIINLPLAMKPVLVESGCDIGAGTSIMPGVILGEGTQVGAGAVVTKDTQKNSIVAGVPAKLIRMRKKK